MEQQKVRLMVLVGVLIVVAIGAGAYFVSQNGSIISAPISSQFVSPSPSESPDSTADWKTYKNDKFELKYPPTWQISTQKEGVLNTVYFKDANLGKAENNYMMLSINFAPNQGGLTADEWWIEASKDPMGLNYFYKKVGTIMITGLNAVEVKASETVAGSPGPRYIFTTKDKGGWLFDIDFKNVEKTTINQTLSTFKFTEPTVSDVSTADWKTYKNEQYGFEVKYPSGWAYPDKSYSGSELTILVKKDPNRSPDNQGPYMPKDAAIKVVIVDKGGKSLDKIVDEYIKNLQLTSGEGAVNKEELVVDGKRAIRIQPAFFFNAQNIFMYVDNYANDKYLLVNGIYGGDKDIKYEIEKIQESLKIK